MSPENKHATQRARQKVLLKTHPYAESGMQIGRRNIERGSSLVNSLAQEGELTRVSKPSKKQRSSTGVELFAHVSIGEVEQKIPVHIVLSMQRLHELKDRFGDGVVILLVNGNLTNDNIRENFLKELRRVKLK